MTIGTIWLTAASAAESREPNTAHSKSRFTCALVVALLIGLPGCGDSTRVERSPDESAADDPTADGAEATTPAHPTFRNLVLISIDTLRADRLGCYGYERQTSPNIDRFAARSLLFSQATSAATNTTPSHMSMFTGLHASVHGQFNLKLGKDSEALATAALLPESMPTLAERLDAEGFRTLAYTDGGYLTAELAFDRGFDEFQRQAETVDRKVDRVLKRLANVNHDERVFLFVHTYEVHSPYVPPVEHDLFTDKSYDGPWVEKVAKLRANAKRGGFQGGAKFLPPKSETTRADQRQLSNLYDGGIHFTDAEIGRLLVALTSGPWADDTAILLLSDHGEGFLEHDTFSHGGPYHTITHVPFILHLPGGPTGRIDAPVSGVDVSPTILELLGLPAATVSDGISVMGKLPSDRAILSYSNDPAKGGGLSLQIGDEKLLRTMSAAPWERYDLGSDPGEQHPLPMDTPEARNMVRRAENEAETLSELAEALREGVSIETGELSDETLESLRALGYIGEDDG